MKTHRLAATITFAMLLGGVALGGVALGASPVGAASPAVAAGYIAGTTTSRPFTKLTVTATVPSLSCHGTHAQEVVWSTQLYDVAGNHAGDEAEAAMLLECAGTKPVYEVAAVDFKPNGSSTFMPLAVNPKAGDSVTELITNGASGSVVDVYDHTNRENGTKTYSLFAATVAGVTVETQPPAQVPNFGTMSFTQVMVNGVGMGALAPNVRKYSLPTISISPFSNGGTAFSAKFV